MDESKPSYNDAPIEGMDWMLQNLIKLAEQGAEIGVTLTTTGGTVCGNVISGKRYLEIVEGKFQRAEGPVAGAMAEWAKAFIPVVSEWNEGGPYFIHLSNVRMDMAGQLAKTESVWRGNLTHVTGLMFGLPS
ncbi:hypothetical protein K8U54_19220 [Pseudomonas fulva]|uniref:hypothetical protein n=1 Tax=Pseudomonas fulva TaxID=47880 RepID=UPI00201DB1A2|nr:hypothetical protein [Pseudomonas fulva]UQY33822.1 hypothetical protein K8U54_19220 [Pseudomonas fulva]